MALIVLMFRNAVRNRRRSVLTILSIAASFCLLGVMMAMYGMFFLQKASNDQASRLIVRNRVSFAKPMPIAYESRIRMLPGVRAVTTFDYFGGAYKSRRDKQNYFPRFAVEPRMLYVVHPDYVLTEAEKNAFARERDACIVGKSLADRLGLKIGDRVTLVGDLIPATLELVVRGIYRSAIQNDMLFFQYEYLNQMAYRGSQSYAMMYEVLAASPAQAPGLAQTMDEMFSISDTQTKSESEQSFALSMISFLGNVKAFLLAIFGALAATVLLVSANTMAMSVRERITEVGVLKTLGFTRQNVLFLILGESVTLALAGGALGFALAEVILLTLRNVQASSFFTLESLQIPPLLALFALLLAMTTGVASSFLPAWSAARRAIIDCLRRAD